MTNWAIYYNPKSKDFAKIARNQEAMTKYEWIFRNMVLKWNQTWYRFLRQKVISLYILDFYCGKLKLWIEIDGDSHNYSIDYDQNRTNFFKELWIKIIRYTNNDIQKNLDWVIIDLQEKIKLRKEDL